MLPGNRVRVREEKRDEPLLRGLPPVPPKGYGVEKVVSDPECPLGTQAQILIKLDGVTDLLPEVLFR